MCSSFLVFPAELIALTNSTQTSFGSNPNYGHSPGSSLWGRFKEPCESLALLCTSASPASFFQSEPPLCLPSYWSAVLERLVHLALGLIPL